jgi:predicted DNA-binding ribbon-helix-helix protein
MINASLKKHSVTLSGHSTSITIEDVFWKSLKDIAQEKGISLKSLVEEIDQNRDGNLCSALRVYVCLHYKNLLAQ